MELFHKIYNCYFNVVRHILSASAKNPISRSDMDKICRRYGFEESSLIILPKLTDGTWPLMEETGIENGPSGFISRLNKAPAVPPLTNLQKSWLRSLLNDRRLPLFLEEDDISSLEIYLSDTPALYNPQDFRYFDQYLDGDSYDSDTYRSHFKTVLKALKEQRSLIIIYEGRRGLLTLDAVPYQLQYSSKDDKFRLCCLEFQNGKYSRSTILNMARVKSCQMTTQKAPKHLNAYLFRPVQKAKEPVQIEISGERNSLERCMLHFANYEKHTQYDEDRKCWLCSIYYDLADETELLIDILSFGPVIRVLGPKSFVRQIRSRVERQHQLFYSPIENITDSRLS